LLSARIVADDCCLYQDKGDYRVTVNIYVDESGNFRSAPRPDSWCTIVAYASPEGDHKALKSLMKALRADCGKVDEVKLRDIPERRYARFLSDLSGLNGLAFATAMDAGLHTDEGVLTHQEGQVEKVIEHVDLMLHSEARRGLNDLAVKIKELPIQLYAQLVCQVELFHLVLTRCVAYYALRDPATLRRFAWRIDRKDTIPTAYENAFRTILPALLQTKSHRDPMLMIRDAGDYRPFFHAYQYPPGEEPTYLRDDYGLDIEIEGAIDVGKMVRDDFQLLDSASSAGLQVADLLASGVRRVMRGNFDRPDAIAALLGSNMLQEMQDRPPLRLIGLGDGETQVSDRCSAVVRRMVYSAKPLLTRGLASTANRE
jgi:hypothetical protein